MADETVAAPAGAPTGESMGQAEVSIDAPEPWEPFETQLVVWSIGIGVAGLIILGTLINLYILD